MYEEMAINFMFAQRMHKTNLQAEPLHCVAAPPRIYSFSACHSMGEKQSREFIKAMEELRKNNPGPITILSEFFPIHAEEDVLGSAVLKYRDERGISTVYMDSVMPHLFFGEVTAAYYNVAISYRANAEVIKTLSEIHNLALAETSTERSEHMLSKINEAIASNSGGALVIVCGAMHIDQISGRLAKNLKISGLNSDPDVESLLKETKRALVDLGQDPHHLQLLKNLRRVFDEEIAPVSDQITRYYLEGKSSLSDATELKVALITDYFVRMLTAAVDPFA